MKKNYENRYCIKMKKANIFQPILLCHFFKVCNFINCPYDLFLYLCFYLFKRKYIKLKSIWMSKLIQPSVCMYT